MSKKKTEQEEKKIEEEVTSKKKTPKKKKEEPKPTGEKKTLIELVKTSNIPRQLMIILLDENNYLNQFYEEERKLEKEETIKPTITEMEFNKIIGRIKK